MDEAMAVEVDGVLYDLVLQRQLQQTHHRQIWGPLQRLVLLL
jgi:hypothetical protein